MKFNDYWNLPQNAKSFFSFKQEKELKEKYGVFYIIHTILLIIIILIPFVAFFAVIPPNAFTPTTQIDNVCGSIGAILGMMGSASISLGLSNIFMALIKQYLGHWVTLIALVGGISLDILSLFVFTFVK